MIAFLYLLLLIAFTLVYALFLERVRQGLDHLLAEASDTGSTRDAIPDDAPRVSVVVACRDEAERIPHLVASLRDQSYPCELTEFILVDDHSTDGTAERIESETAGDTRFRHIRLDGTSAAGKKSAIAAGVVIAAGSIIVTTDADCAHRPGWLGAMTRGFADGADLVAGPVVYPRGNRLAARLQALEFLGLVGVGAGLFGVGYPRLCNGANLAYRKECFARAAAFRTDDPVASGDDEFLMHAIVYRLGGDARFEAAPDALVVTAASASIGSFFSQRARWASKGLHYEDARFIAFLTVLFAYFALLVCAPFAVIGSSHAVVLCALLYACKAGLDLRVLLRAARLFRSPLRLPDWFLAECLHPPYLVIASLLGTVRNITWKNRPIRATPSR
jgi:poly-beta-1,6-N-acetyl-D-glucosamine synthase